MPAKRSSTLTPQQQAENISRKKIEMLISLPEDEIPNAVALLLGQHQHTNTPRPSGNHEHEVDRAPTPSSSSPSPAVISEADAKAVIYHIHILFQRLEEVMSGTSLSSAAAAGDPSSSDAEGGNPLPFLSLLQLLTESFGSHSSAEEAFREAFAPTSAGTVIATADKNKKASDDDHANKAEQDASLLMLSLERIFKSVFLQRSLRHPTLRDVTAAACVSQQKYCSFMCETADKVAVSELLVVVGAVCSIAPLREACGAMFMIPVREAFIQHTRKVNELGEPLFSFSALRALGSILIHCINGSKENKVRLPSWAFVCDVMGSSSDLFFQIQCVEILFRLARPDPRVIDEWRHRCTHDRVRSVVLSRLKALLPTPSAQLFHAMAELVEKLNLDGVPKREQTVVAIPVKTVTLGAEENVIDAIYRVYFTPNSFTILLDGPTADNITVPYTCIRSVKVSNDGCFAFKLNMAPHRIREHVMVDRVGHECVTIEVSSTAAKQFRASPVQKWIVEALERRKLLSTANRKHQHHQQQHEGGGGGGGGGEGSSSHEKKLQHQQLKRNSSSSNTSLNAKRIPSSQNVQQQHCEEEGGGGEAAEFAAAADRDGDDQCVGGGAEDYHLDDHAEEDGISGDTDPQIREALASVLDKTPAGATLTKNNNKLVLQKGVVANPPPTAVRLDFEGLSPMPPTTVATEKSKKKGNAKLSTTTPSTTPTVPTAANVANDDDNDAVNPPPATNSFMAAAMLSSSSSVADDPLRVRSNKKEEGLLGKKAMRRGDEDAQEEDGREGRRKGGGRGGARSEFEFVPSPEPGLRQFSSGSPMGVGTLPLANMSRAEIVPPPPPTPKLEIPRKTKRSGNTEEDDETVKGEKTEKSTLKTTQQQRLAIVEYADDDDDVDEDTDALLPNVTTNTASTHGQQQQEANRLNQEDNDDAVDDEAPPRRSDRISEKNQDDDEEEEEEGDNAEEGTTPIDKMKVGLAGGGKLTAAPRQATKDSSDAAAKNSDVRTLETALAALAKMSLGVQQQQQHPSSSAVNSKSKSGRGAEAFSDDATTPQLNLEAAARALAEELKIVIINKVHRMRSEATEVMSQCVALLQAGVNATRAENSERLKAFNAMVREGIDAAVAAEGTIACRVEEALAELNTELVSIKERSTVQIKDEIAFTELEARQALNKAQEASREQLIGIKRRVDSTTRLMADAIDHATTAMQTNAALGSGSGSGEGSSGGVGRPPTPMDMLKRFLSQQLEEQQTVATHVKGGGGAVKNTIAI